MIKIHDKLRINENRNLLDMSLSPDWRFIISPPHNAAYNMAVDEALMRGIAAAAAAGSPSPVLRVYSWSGPAVSIGYNQKVERELDLDRCRSLGIQVVRRPTGGRAVFHSGELTYSVAGPGDTESLGRTINRSYRLIAAGIIKALALLSVEPDIEETGRKRREARGLPHGSGFNPCFTSVSRYEISFNGRKLIGSAQRRMGAKKGFLQQGSLIMKNTQARLAELVPGLRDEKERRRLGEFLTGRAVGLEEILGRQVEFDEVARAFRLGFGKAFGCSVIPCGLTEEENALAERLELERYSTEEWLLGGNK